MASLFAGAEASLYAAAVLGLVLLAAKLGEEAASRLGLPAFIGAVVAGFILGDAGVGLAGREVLARAGLLFSLGVNFMLFLAGAEELTYEEMAKPKLVDLTAGAVASIAAGAAAALLAHRLLSLPWRVSAAYGLAVGMASLGPAVKIALSARRPPLRLLSAVLAAEFTSLMLFNVLEKGVTPYMVAATVAVFAFAFKGRGLVAKVLNWVEDRIAAREAPFAFIVATVLAASYTAELLGFNAAITALLLGLVFSDYLHRRVAYLERLYAFTYGFFEPLFFAGIGLYAVRPTPADLLVAAALVAIPGAAKAAVVVASGSAERPRQSLIMLAKGGVDAALLLTMLDAGSIGGHAYAAGVTATIISVLVATLAVPRARSRAMEKWRVRLEELELDHAVVPYDAPLSIAAAVLAGRSAAVVVDHEGRPLGYITAEDLMHVDPALFDRLRVASLMRIGVVEVPAKMRLADLIHEGLTEQPIIAVVDEKGRVVGTVTPQQLLRKIIAREHELPRKQRQGEERQQ